MKLIKLFAVLLLLVFASSSFAQGSSQGVAPTEQQLEQFQKLPKSQQKALAEKYGISLYALGFSTDGESSDDEGSNKNSSSILPRDLDKKDS